ncbi:hypothetical protein Ctha_2322 [Chloroherpeton thalassium ATCC 35110]|uniref:Antitoxin n=1 Tax=Chloroherpeton thalassium (strain ATCC 35110 / GB-78) TaxID=517418 RepID=B3QWL2_CHLT3|nr:hypothetical protein [Chloroherpeton thalassium]ACF14772.1 hypothetical protein Ctha_2322 [Chloroherpeton thalassium ATCC 35110]
MESLKDPKYVTDKDGNRIAVMLDIEEYEKIMDALDELNTILAYDKAKRNEPDYLPYNEAMKEIREVRLRNGLK